LPLAFGNQERIVKIGVLANDGSWYWNDLRRAALDRGYSICRLEFSTVAARCGFPTDRSSNFSSFELDSTRIDQSVDQSNASRIAECDAIIVRTMPPGSLEQVVFRMDALAALAATGVDIVNSPKSIECAVDKYLTTARLEAAGLPVPLTITCQETETAMLAFEELGGDVVVKPLFGSEGRGIVRVSDPDLAFRTFRTLERTNSVLYLQQFIDHEGFDVRVLVLDGTIVGAMTRASPNDFRTNVSREATAKPHIPNEFEVNLALRAAQAADCRIAGIDLLYGKNGDCVVLEVNAVPGWKSFNQANDTDVAGLLIDSLAK
jgi:ribosomal protein S6--L-glutamate ligase